MASVNLAKLRTVRQFTDENPAFSQDYLRYLILQSEHFGLNECLYRIGVKIFIDEDKFSAWLERQPQRSMTRMQKAREAARAAIAQEAEASAVPA